MQVSIRLRPSSGHMANIKYAFLIPRNFLHERIALFQLEGIISAYFERYN